MIKRALFNLLSLLPYPAGNRLISSTAGLAIVQRTIFRHASRGMSRCKERFGLDQSVAAMTRQHVVSTLFDPWRIRKLGTMDKNEYQRWVSITNSELITSALQRHQGVLIAICHIGMARFLPLALAREGIDCVVLEADSYYKKLALPGAEKMKSIEIRSSEGFYLKVLFQARKVLKNKGVLLMAPDGLQGMGKGSPHSFLGKERTFHGSFAAMAAQTGAVVIWTSISVRDDGRIDVRFEKSPRLDGASEEEVSTHLVSQYVGFVENVWREDITRVGLHHLTSFLSL